MTKRNRFIDVAKGIAIILVLFNHYFWPRTSIFNTHLNYWIISMAVPIFMLCTGYVTAASFESKNISLIKAYRFEILCPKFVRYIMPFLWFYIAETVLTFVFQKSGYINYLSALDYSFSEIYEEKMSFLQILEYFLEGGRGLHGTYYFPVIIQVAFMIPVIYTIVRKYNWGLWVCFTVNLLLEILKNQTGMPSDVYRIYAFRYIFALAFGCYLYVYRDKEEKWYKWLAFFVIGVIYTYRVNYTSHDRIIFTYWYRNSMMSMFYLTPIFLLGIKYLKNIRCTILEELGKSSYHILMVQILYYNFLAPLWCVATKGWIISDYVGMILSLVVCLCGGYGYYVLYNYLKKKIN